MASEEIYELSLPILKDPSLDEEEKTDKLEELLRNKAQLTGSSLEEAVLNVLWRHREAINPSLPTSPARPILGRRVPTGSWQISRSSTPVASPLLGSASLARVKSATGSPFTSPRPSPRLAFSTPIPHSPSLSHYEFSIPSSDKANYGDYGSDFVDGLVNDDLPSRPTSSSAGSMYGSTLSGAAQAWTSTQESNMSLYEMMRYILGESKSDEEIEAALEANGYDLSATVTAFMESPGMYEEQSQAPTHNGQVLIGKSMLSSPSMHTAQLPANRSTTVCKYLLASGQCLRADCRFSHDLNNHICKYFLAGKCLAGDACLFSHDPAALLNQLSLGGATSPSLQPSFQVQDYDAFPALQAVGFIPAAGSSYAFSSSQRSFSGNAVAFSPSRILMGSSPRSQGSRPTSRQSSRPTTPSILSVDDNDAFPSLGAGGKSIKKHHGKRGHGHNSAAKENIPSSLAEVVRLSPSPAPGLLRKGLMKTRSYVGSRENSVAANAIPPPEHVPWLETGEKANQAYIKARQDAFKHGGLRNKFLQSAAQAWNRNDARAAKALSLRGQSENEHMRQAHREAARVLYEERNKDAASSTELYVDLHGLHPEEAVEYLERVLLEQQKSSKPVYAITGTGHHSKNGKDKVGKAVRTWLIEWKYAFREFSVPGDRGNIGGILGIDAKSFDRNMLDEKKASEAAESSEEGGLGTDTKVRIVKEAPTGPRARS